MVTIEKDEHRKREYILVRRGQLYYYARASRTDPTMYDIMVNVSEKEGREIVNKANQASDFNRAIDEATSNG